MSNNASKLAEYNYLVARKVFAKGGLTEVPMYWTDEKELNLLALAKRLVLEHGVVGVAAMMTEGEKENKDGAD